MSNHYAVLYEVFFISVFTNIPGQKWEDMKKKGHEKKKEQPLAENFYFRATKRN